MKGLYGIIQLKDEWSIARLATTLFNRHDLTHSVKALHLDQYLENRQHLRERHLCQRLAALCRNSFLKANELALNPDYRVFKSVDQSPPPWPSRCHLSISCTIDGWACSQTETFRATHLHLGVGKSSSSSEVFARVNVLIREYGRQVRMATTHLAIDWDPESNSRWNLILLIGELLRKAAPTL